MELKDSGERQVFGTGAQRDTQEGKGRMDLLPMRALIEVAKLYEAGAKKYKERNWENGIPLERYVDSGLRHLSKFMSGQTDEAHLTQATWNLLCCLDTLLRIKEGILPRSLAESLPFKEIKLMQETFETNPAEIPFRIDQLKGPYAMGVDPSTGESKSCKSYIQLSQEQIEDIKIFGGNHIDEQVGREISLDEVLDKYPLRYVEETNKELQELAVEEQAYGDQI